MNSTDTSATGAFAEQLVNVFRGAFSRMLLSDATNQSVWASRLESLRKHGLLTVRLPSPFRRPVVEIDQSRLETDHLYRRRIAKQLAKPRPSLWNYVNLQVDRLRFQSDEAYREAVCDYVTTLWVRNLITSDEVERLVLLKAAPAYLGDYLDQFGPHQIDVGHIKNWALRRLCEDLIDQNPSYQALEAEFRETCRLVREETMADIRATLERHHLERLQKLDAIQANFDERCAEIVQEAGEGARAASERSATVLKLPDDPETEWREALARHEREWREANKWSPFTRVLVTVASLAVVAVVVLFAEVDGVSLAKLIFSQADSVADPN